ncbi:glutamine ABC transporter ATP-binding protein [Aerococcus urinaehominis]|uniref:Glutamine ABC transporter ATP-binding protein n=1 Tax=Aerococcus urinaehominis TaxID=128944 RepID=A0A0X8FM54_9LACT|nr:amino acid ABC transporter ATP-binding protein [Aerococcus urinaehominis]AMB99840.1 glutamine ABC transporter ATP-binding protein [Aerococcus urinaehominis]SDM62740.1 polar amino acid transport system ATP-binding protein [Aerococcus urinaehominis]
MTENLMQIRGVHKSFGDKEILRGIDLDIPLGQVTTIIGPSGSGKSTLLRCLNGLEKIDQGSLVFKGQEIGAREADWQNLRQEIGMVFQSYDLFPNLSILDNCCLAPIKVLGQAPDQAQDTARQLLAQVGLAGYEDRKPSALSGGQKQRVAIVRCLCMAPSLILLDEITASLDPEIVNEVLLVILDLAKQDKTMVIVTHEMSFARRVSDQIVFLDQGQVVEVSPVAAFFDRPQSQRAQDFLASLNFDNFLAANA